MKKLIFIFAVLFTIVLVSGCGARQNTIRYNNGSETEEVTGDEISEGEEDALTEEVSEAEESDEEDEEGEKEAENTEEAAELEVPTGKLAVTSFDGAFLKTNLSYNVVKGTCPSDTHEITINDYKLQKYIPGQTQWDYIASTRFNTLKSGLNTYILKTYDAEGVQTDSLIFSINYDSPVIPEALPGVGSSHWLVLIATLIMTGCYVTLRRFRWL